MKFNTSESFLNFIRKEGKKNVRFLVPMRKSFWEWVKNPITVLDENEIVECVISEEEYITRYKLEDNYKVTLKSIRDGRYEHYYVSDLKSLINEGIVKIDMKPAFLG